MMMLVAPTSRFAEQLDTKLPPAVDYLFDFGDSTTTTGARVVEPNTAYSKKLGYGFEGASEFGVRHISDHAVNGDAIGSDKPFFFSVSVPEGSYRLTVTVGGDKAGEVTIKGEDRRLLARQIKTNPKQTKQVTFTLNTRTEWIDDRTAVRIKDREREGWNWDDKLTLEFNGTNPSVASVRIESAPELPTIYIAGDSTVTDGRSEPWSGWGQMLPYFFDDQVVVANYAESGRTLLSFAGERRLQKILSRFKPGDYLLIQFGHNDMKQKGDRFGPYKNYKQELIDYINEVRERGGTPILVTPMHRRTFGNDGKIQDSHGDYPDAMRLVAKETDTLLIDLNKMSKTFYEAMGSTGSTKAFVHYPANTFPGQDKVFQDNSHHSPYGAFQLAKCVVTAIHSQGPDALKAHLRKDFNPFDPAQPDDPDTFDWPYSPPTASLVTPEGS